MLKALYFRILILSFLFSFSISSYSQTYLKEQYTSEKTFDEIVEIGNEYFEIIGTGKGVGYKQFKRWEYWNQRNLDENGRIISNSQTRKEINKFNSKNPPSRNIGEDFTEMGPSSAINTSTWSSHIGRITSIALDPNDEDHIIVGSSSGGVWKTEDFAQTWTPVFEEETFLDVFSLEISHANSNHYFAGTNGGGILKSTDGGITWNSTTGIETNDVINTLIMHPTNSNILFAIGRWQGRVYKSINGGNSWTTELDIDDQLHDLEFKPGSPNTMYVSGRGTLRRSFDGGNSFNNIISGPWTNSGTIMMAVTPDDPNYLYLLQEDSGGFGGVYLSTNGGSSFSTKSNDSCNCNNMLGYNLDEGGGQAPRDMDIIVSPTDRTEVHIAGVETYRSYTSGSSWTNTTSWIVNDDLPFIHADCDILIYRDNQIFAGTDGGIFYSDDEANSFNDLTSGLGVREFYRIGASETDIDRVSGGSQDNGTGVIKSGTWFDFVGADGMETFIDHSNEDIIYTCIQFGGLYKTTNGGNTIFSPNQPSGSGAWVTPLEQDPNNSNTLYIGERHLWKSVNGANSWSQISNINTANSNDDLIKELKIAPTNSNVIYLAYEEQLFKTTNGGSSWTDISPPVGFSSVNYISIHPDDENRVSVTLSGSSQKIMETTNGGNSWSNITFNLPLIGAECVTYEAGNGDGMFIGMNPGLYYKNNLTGNNWTDVSANIPNVAVVELEIRNNTLYAGTYGRGLWKNQLSENTGNYTCQSAQEISSCGSFTTLAIDQGDGANHNDATNSVWYKFTSDFTGEISISSCEEGVDTRLWIYNGNCGSLNTIASSDDDCLSGSNSGNTASKISGLSVIAGESIYLEWDDFGSPDSFTFEIDYNINNNCQNAISALPGSIIVPPLTSSCGQASGATQTDATKAAWYKFIAPNSGIINIYSCNGGVDTRLWIHDGDCENLNLLTSSDDTCEMSPGGNLYAAAVYNLPLSTGQEIYLEWDDRWSSDGFTFIIRYQGSCPTEINITGDQNSTITYQSQEIIESDQVLNSPADIIYDSGSSIELIEGFEVNVGAAFEAIIGGCGNLINSEGSESENKR